MKQVKDYLKLLYQNKYKNEGFFYSNDDDLFPTRILNKRFYSFFREHGYLSSGPKRKERLGKYIEELNSKDSDLYFRDDKEDILTLFNYQLYLDEMELDGRSKFTIRNLFKKLIFEIFPNVKQENSRYFYDQDRIKLLFVESLISFIQIVSDLSDNEEVEKSKIPELYFRGHASIQWKLIPKVYRELKWINHEDKMFREVIIRNSEEFFKTSSTFQDLTIMQHHGLPTRLLDITKNPLIALYFACNSDNYKKIPGEVIVFEELDYNIKFYDSDVVSILANLAKADRSLSISTNIPPGFNSLPSIKKFLDLIRGEKPYFTAGLIPTDFKRTVMVKPINNNERIKRQMGSFFLFGMNSTIDKPAQIKTTYQRNKIRYKIIIDGPKKAKICHELDSIGISHNTLFPEIDNGTEYIQEKYN